MYPFRKDLFATESRWYVACWGEDVTAQPIERWILNRPLVLYRDSAGRVIALDGRCPHRGFPLAKGRVCEDVIECGYHGMRFDTTGACVHIPTQEHIPPKMRVASYPVHEVWNWVWIWMGDPQLANVDDVPDHIQLGLTDTANWEPDVRVYSHVAARYQLLHDNLLDLSHVGFLHGSTIGTADLARTQQRNTHGEDWLNSTRYVTDATLTPALAAAWGVDGVVDRELSLTFTLPCLHWGHDRFLRSRSLETADAGRELAVRRIYHAITPATRNSAHYFFVRASGLHRSGPAPTLKFDYRKIIDEDVAAVEEVERLLAAGVAPVDVSVRSDSHAVKARDLLERMILADQHNARADCAHSMLT